MNNIRKLSYFLKSDDYEGFLNYAKLNGLDITNDTLLNLSINEYYKKYNYLEDKNFLPAPSLLREDIKINYKLDNIKLIINYILSYYKYQPSNKIKNKILDFDEDEDDIDMNNYLIELFIHNFPLWSTTESDILKILRANFITGQNMETRKYILNNLINNNNNNKSDILKRTVFEMFDMLFDSLTSHINNEDNEDNEDLIILLKLVENFSEIITYNRSINNNLINNNDKFKQKIIYKIFEVILRKTPNIVFDIIEKNQIYAIQLAKITSSDLDYHPYIKKYLKILIKYTPSLPTVET